MVSRRRPCPRSRSCRGAAWGRSGRRSGNSRRDRPAGSASVPVRAGRHRRRGFRSFIELTVGEELGHHDCGEGRVPGEPAPSSGNRPLLGLARILGCRPISWAAGIHPTGKADDQRRDERSPRRRPGTKQALPRPSPSRGPPGSQGGGVIDWHDGLWVRTGSIAGGSIPEL